VFEILIKCVSYCTTAYCLYGDTETILFGVYLIMTTRYLLDADLILEGLLDRPKLSSDAVDVWGQLELNNPSDEGYITSIGLNKIIEVLRTLIEMEQDADEVINYISSRLQEIEVDREIIQEALELDLNSKDFESAIEIACAKEYQIDAIVTDRKDAFPFPISRNKFLANYELKIMNSEEFVVKSKENALKVPQTDSRFSSLEDSVFTAAVFVDEYGGEDLGDYGERYDVIERYWPQLKDILTFCYERALSDQIYSFKFLHIWNQLNHFSDLYNHYNDRIHYLELGIELSAKYSVSNNLFDYLTRKAWTLIMQNEFNEAKESLERAEEILNSTTICSSSLSYFYHCYFTFFAHSNDLKNAEDILVKQFYFAGAIEGEDIDSGSLKRREINCLRNSAKLDHLQAKATKKENSKLFNAFTERSLKKYQLCLDNAISLGWRRMTCYLYNKIADIYLDLAEDFQDNLSKRSEFLEIVEEYLDRGQPIAIINRNQRRIAGYDLSRGRLSNILADDLERVAKIEKYNEAICNCEKAKDKYKQDNNQNKIEECDDLIEDSRVKRNQLATI
jgi:predicted nucleic acid-binding protein